MFAILDWNEVALVMTIGTFVMVWIMIMIGFGVKLRRQAARIGPTAAPVSQSTPQGDFSASARSHFFAAVLLLVVLSLLTPLGWLILGQAGMPLVRICTIGVVLSAIYLVVAAAIAIATSKSATAQRTFGAIGNGGDAPSQVELVARLTQRFCPQCRAPLAADAPEGLCPACLMAGGVASAAAVAPANGMAATTPPSGSQPPTAGEWANLEQHFPHLEILELLGRGGMGAVYKARQKNLDRLVALKVIPPEAAKDPTFAERFAREARALARLNHPNIVTVYDFGQAGDVYWLLMEYVDGVNLRHALRAARLSPPEALAIVPQICDALQYAHDQGVVHRDIKPENVLLDRYGRVKIADFGLAKMLGKTAADVTLTGTQQVMGTPRYMAPEQIEKPTAVDHRADIYSLGVVFYEMLTGELPIGRFQPPSQKVQVDVRIDDVVLRTLEKEPDRRYQRASQVKTELASATRPTWHTPAPAVKTGRNAGASASTPALVIALLIAGLFAVASGLGAIAHLPPAHDWFSPAWWGSLGVGSVGIVGGLILLAAAYTVHYHASFGRGSQSLSPLEAVIMAVNTGGMWLRRLARSPRDQWVGGVCGGLGETTPIPAWCWRMLFLVLIFGYGVGVLAYIALWICLPEAKVAPAALPTSDQVTAWLHRMARSRRDAVLGGVCGGLGEHTPIPSWCWRLLFVVLTLMYGVGVIPYLLFWICLPEEKKADAGTPMPPADAPVADGRPTWQPPAPAAKAVHQPASYAPASPASRWTGCLLVCAGTLMLLLLLCGGGLALIWTYRLAQRPEEASVAAELEAVGPLGDAASDVDFDRLLKSLRAESIDQKKLSFIKLVSNAHSFTSEQARQLLQAFDLDPIKEQAALILYPRVTDSQNFFRVLEVFNLDPNRNSVRKRLKLDRPPKALAEEPGEATSKEEFKRLMAGIKRESFDAGRAMFVNMVSHGRAFTCDQARELLATFDFDPEREDAAVAIYSRLSDPQNFYRVLEVFTFDSGRESVRKRLKLD